MDSLNKESGPQGGSDFGNDETEKKKMNPKEIAINFAKKAAIFIVGYVVCYLNLSLTLPILTICTLVFFETQTSGISKKISSKSKASSYSKKDLLKVVDELPSWVTFPDRERAEWLNEIVGQLWPSISLYIIKLCRTKLQTKIQKKFDAFKFEEIDFGLTPPKIDGVKVYNKSVTKDSIIIDFDLYYDGDCTINFSVSGTQIGCIKDFQVGAELRLVLKPLMIKMPLIGGIQIFFLNTPDINFELDGISGIPGFSYFIRQKIEERITKKLVFPNKITKRFSKSVEAAELKSLEPAGVLRVHVFEAKDLERKDVTGKSDPYVVLTVGAQEHKTPVIKRELNPRWDYWCEFVILDPVGQHLHFKMFDQDDLNEDDFMGSGIIEIHHAIKDGENDKWFNLDNARHGKIHLRFTWLGLSANQEDLQAALKEITLLKVADISSALLTIYLDTAQDLQRVKSRKPESYVILTVNKNQQKSKVKKHTCDPMWEQGFSICVPNPENDSLHVSIIDKGSDTKLGQLTYHIKDLFRCPDMQISKEEFHLSNSPGKIVISLQLRILTHNNYECEESDTESENETSEISRDHSVRSSSRKQRTITTSTSVNDSTPPKTPSQPHTPVIEKEVTFERQSSLRSSQSSIKSSAFKVRPDLGQMEISLFYSAPRQKLVITIHRISNLPLKDPSHIPDPYVKLKLIGLGSQKLKNKTKVIIDNCDPVYEETFEYLVSNSDLPNNKLVLTVKSKKMFHSFVMGQVTINLNNFQGLNEPFKEWYELSHAEESD